MADSDLQAVAEQAGFFAAHAIWCVSDGGPLIPFLAFDLPDGRREMVRLVAETLESGVEEGRRRLAMNPDGATRAVLVLDGFLRLALGKRDALILEAEQYRPTRMGFRLAVPYRASDSPEGSASFLRSFLIPKSSTPRLRRSNEPSSEA